MVTDRHGTGLLYQPTKAAKIFTWLVAVYKETLNQLSDLGGEVNVLYRVLFWCPYEKFMGKKKLYHHIQLSVSS